MRNPTPVIIIKKIAESGSRRKENETEKLPALNQSNTGTTTDLPDIEKKILIAITNDASMVVLPIIPATDLDNLLFKRPRMINPIRGKRGINAANCNI